MQGIEKTIMRLYDAKEYFCKCRINASLGSNAENHFFELQNAMQEAIERLEKIRLQETKRMTKELVEVLALTPGFTVWVEQRTTSGNYLQPMISDGEGHIGCFGLGISVKDIESPNYRYWSGCPTDEQMKAVKWDDEQGNC